MRAAMLLVCGSGLAAGVWCGPATGQVSGGPTGQSAGQDASGLPTGGGLIGSVMFEGVYASGDMRLSVTSTGGSSMVGMLSARGEEYAVRGTLLPSGVFKGEFERGESWQAFEVRPGGDGSSVVMLLGLDEYRLMKQGVVQTMGVASPAAAMQMHADPSGVVAMLPGSWVVQRVGGQASFGPQPAAGMPQQVSYQFGVLPWQGGMDLMAAGGGEMLGQMMAQSMPGIESAGPVQRLGGGQGDGIRLDFRMTDPAFAGFGYRMYAKVADGSLIVLSGGGPTAALDGEESAVRQIFSGSRVGGRSAGPDAATAQKFPQVVTHATGVSMRHPAGWSVAHEADKAVLSPPGVGGAPSGVTLQLDAQAWEMPMPVTHPEMTAQLAQAIGLHVPGFVLEAAPDLVAADTVRLRFRGMDPGSGQAMRVMVLGKSVGNRYLSMATVGLAGAVDQLEGLSIELFATAQPVAASIGSGEQFSAKYPHVVGGAAHGFSVRHPAGWMGQAQGAGAVLMLPPPQGQTQPQEMLTLMAMPWVAGMPVQNEAVAEQIGAMFAQTMPGLRREGRIVVLGSGPTDGVMIPLSMAVAPGQVMQVRMYVKNDERAMVAMMAMGDPALLGQRDAMLREIFQTVTILGTPPVVQASAAPQGGWGVQPQQQQPQQQAPGWGQQAGPGGQGALGPVDPNVVGVWASESAMSSPAPWNDLGQGGTTFVTKTVYAFSPDGTYQLGSMAGSGSGQWSIVDGGLQVSHAGYWAAMATQNGNYIVLVDQHRQQHQIRYTFHNGQLVLGESGSRSFWSRAR